MTLAHGARLAVWTGAALALAPASMATACAVCGGNTPERSKLAFILTTALLTFLPLTMLGGFGWWLHRRVKALEGPPEGAPQDSVGLPPSSPP